jgi:hypothetical protein
LAYWEPAQQVGVIDLMSGQNVIDHLIDFGQLYTPVYEEVQYEAQVQPPLPSRCFADKKLKVLLRIKHLQ